MFQSFVAQSALKVSISFILFRVSQVFIRWALVENSLPAQAGVGSEKSFSSHKKWRISNESISLLHSVISGVWAAYSLMFYSKLATDMIDYRCDVAVDLVLLSAGYLLHDAVDLVTNEKGNRIAELMFHHVVVLGGLFVTLVTNKYLGGVMCALLMELNSMFLHARTLMKHYEVGKTSFGYNLVLTANVVTLLLFRVLVSCYLLHWASTVVVTSMPWIQAGITVVLTIMLACSNAVLSYRVLVADGLISIKRGNKLKE